MDATNGLPGKDQLESVANAWADGWASPDSDQWADQYADGGTYHDASFGGIATGDRIAHVFWHDAFVQVFPDFKVTIKHVHAAQDQVIAFYEAEGTMVGNLGQLPPGVPKPVEFKGVGDTVIVSAGPVSLPFERGDDGHFDLSALPTIPGNGKHFRVEQGVMFIRCNADGKIVQAIETYDRLPMFQALGIAF